MKKICIALLLCFSLTKTIAQNNIQGQITDQNINWTYALLNLNTSQITSNVLYSKVTPFSNLYNFNDADFNTSDYDQFAQALSELHRASDQTLFISSTALQNLIKLTPAGNTSDIGMINTTFQFLNYNENTPNDGGLRYENNTFYRIGNKPSFITKKVVVAAPLKKFVVGENAVFKFSNNLIFNNATSSIKKVVVDFGNGTSITVINNGVLTTPIATVNYSSSGNKTLSFTFTFNDNSTFKTYGNIYFSYKSASEGSRGIEDLPCYESLKDKGIFTSTIAYQGFEETSPVKGKIEYTIFYHNNAGNTLRKLLKPIIIIDGFDPGDTRRTLDCDCANDINCSTLDPFQENGSFNPLLHKSIEDMVNYVDENGNPKNLIEKLRGLGYDVIIINNPTYITTNQAGQTVTIDGGADYIQRNAMNLVSYIQQTRDLLITNGSSEKLVLVGPSMGGQISRYALAYMDKMYANTGLDIWKHNTRLWISIDSPHLGSDIPLATQANVFFLGYTLGNDKGKQTYNNLLNSTAARQLLNHQFNSFENASPYQSLFDNYYNNLTTNGVSGSNGYPLSTSTFRKIAMINGSLDGSKTSDGVTIASEKHKYLNIRGYIDLSFWFNHWSITTFRNTDYFMPAYLGGNSLVFVGSKIFGTSFTFIAQNNDIHGSLDVIPGGMLNSQEEIKKQILKGLSEKHSRSEVRDFFPLHSFIPSFSALGHLQPNQNWGNPINTNLTCPTNIKTPFDTYYGESANSTHTSFTQKSVAWLLEELAGNKQAPHFPIQQGVLTGPAIVCESSTHTYSIADICKVPSEAIFSVSGNLVIVGTPSAYSTTVKATSDVPGEGKIIATFQNGQILEKLVHIGAPTVIISESVSGHNFIPKGQSTGYSVNPVTTATSYVWTIVRDESDEPCPSGTNTPKFANGTTTCETTPSNVSINWGNCLGNYSVYCEAKNECGTTGFRGRNIFVGNPQDNPCGNYTPIEMKLSPNPFSSGEIVLNFTQDQLPCTYDSKTIQEVNKNNSYVNIKINNFFGTEVFNKSLPFEELIKIQNLNLIQGIYVVTALTSSGQLIREQIIVN